MMSETFVVTRLGQRGEGVAVASNGLVHVPYALPDETVRAQFDGEIAQLVEVLRPRPDRIAPICPYFETCGGCAVQALSAAPYAEWKRGLVRTALDKVGLAPPVADLVDGHGEGRRRATFHARLQPTPNVLAGSPMRLGFMRARSHEVIDIAQCPILAPGMRDAIPACRALARIVMSLGKPVDFVVTASRGGLDIDMRGPGPLEPNLIRKLASEADALDLARLANHGSVIVERRSPTLAMGKAFVVPPPGAFLQATALGEQVLSELVKNGVGSARKVADLFCGLGTFALRLAETATLTAVDVEGPALQALGKAARATPALRPISTQARDLFHRPLLAPDLDKFDAVVFDPPRAGAEEQAQALAVSKVPTVVAVSCNPATFARDAAILVAGGYRLGSVTPVDQFRYAPHLEIVGVFRRGKSPGRRTLFG